MADKIVKTVSIGTEVDDRPGVLAEVTSAIADAGINLLAAAGYSIGGGRARLEAVAEDPAKLKDLATGMGMSVTETRVFLVQGDDRVGALVETANALARAGANIVACFATAAEGKYAACVAVRPEDFDRAAQALGV